MLNRVFWWRLLIDPVQALDLRDRKGDPDHGKILPAITLFWFMVLATLGKLPSVWYTIILVSASFGWAGWRTFLRSRFPADGESQ